MRLWFFGLSLVGLVASTALAAVWSPAVVLVVLVVLVILLGLYDIAQKDHTLWRNFPVISHARWIGEAVRPMINQYFIESDTDGVPISRMYRSVVYQRAKGELDTVPFGTKMDTYAPGYEWMDHSLGAIVRSEEAALPRVLIGGPACSQPYDASLFNISAMSFGALSDKAVRALNKGARMGRFIHNTGEGGISPYHLQHGGDLIYQVGTGYFGCRDEDGNFCAEAFKKRAGLAEVKMIEVKLSQGAKPGHGGILPAIKNTPEIAEIRGVTPGTRVDSPPTHTAFKTPLDMMQFIGELRELSGGKPVGFKLCLGRKTEFVAICKAMIQSGIKPDFITVDGGEGGTGAAPLEYSNAVGAPLRDGLAFVVDCLEGFDLRKDIRVIASGKVFTGFHLVRLFAIGADVCMSARGMMLALGCVQSLQCNNNKCPTGITTQDPMLTQGLDVEDKADRVAKYHHATLRTAMELVAAGGYRDPHDVQRHHINRRIDPRTVLRYDELYPPMTPGALLQAPCPAGWERLLEAEVDRFQ